MPDSAIMFDEVIESYNEGAKAKKKKKKRSKTNKQAKNHLLTFHFTNNIIKEIIYIKNINQK